MVRHDVGQLLWVGFQGPTVPPALRAQLEAGAVGATIIFKRNLVIQTVGASGAVGQTAVGSGAGGQVGSAVAGQTAVGSGAVGSGALGQPAVGNGAVATTGVRDAIGTSGAIAQEVCDLDALIALNRDLHRKAPDGAPALIAVDQEGGTVQRVRAPATMWPPMMAHDGLPAGEDERIAEQVGRALGEELRALGFDIDFAPVLDVHTNPANPVIGDRAFGRDAQTAARRALAFARGLDAAGLLACGKHFPGHGDTDSDSHLELPKVDHAWDRLDSVELAPFRLAAQAKLPMIMTAHVVFAALDAKRPATLSEQVMTGLLRGKLGYRGVIVSDDLDMRAIAGTMGIDHAAVQAIRAGCDVLLLCCNEQYQQQAEAALIKTGEQDSEFRRRLGESAARVRAMKKAHVANQLKHPVLGRDVIGSFEHRKLADRLAGRA